MRPRKWHAAVLEQLGEGVTASNTAEMVGLVSEALDAAGLRVVPKRNTVTTGRRGRVSGVTPETAARIVRARLDLRWTYVRIAAELDSLGIPTPQSGDRWSPQTVSFVVRRELAKPSGP